MKLELGKVYMDGEGFVVRVTSTPAPGRIRCKIINHTGDERPEGDFDYNEAGLYGDGSNPRYNIQREIAP